MMWNYLSVDMAEDLSNHAKLACRMMATAAAAAAANDAEDERSRVKLKKKKKGAGSISTGAGSKMSNNIKSSDYMNLCFRVKWFYNAYIARLPQCEEKIPEYPKWVVVSF